MTATIAAPLLYIVNDAARQLSVSRSQLYVLMKRGIVTFLHVGKRRMITHETLLAPTTG